MTIINLRDKFTNLEDELNGEILERNHEIRTGVNAILSRKHHFQIGPPGTAKSLLVERICKRISGLGNDGYFRWLLTPHTTPEELFGGPDFSLLREQGTYKRVTTRKMPVSYFSFLDEIFKANSAILNTMLTIMNERQFFNLEDDSSVPLMTVFAASNELPDGENLWAMWDRLHFRHEIHSMQESSNFVRMISQPMVAQPEQTISLDEIREAQDIVRNIVLPKEIFQAMKDLRSDLAKEGIEPTERRWVETKGIIQAEAFLNGHDFAEVEDMRPLMHVLWGDLDHQKTVKKIVLELANPIDKEASELLDRINGLGQDLKDAIADKDDDKALARSAIEIHKKLEKAKSKLNALKTDLDASGGKSEYWAEADRKFKMVAGSLMKDGFGVDQDF